MVNPCNLPLSINNGFIDFLIQIYSRRQKTADVIVICLPTLLTRRQSRDVNWKGRRHNNNNEKKDLTQMKNDKNYYTNRNTVFIKK